MNLETPKNTATFPEQLPQEDAHRLIEVSELENPVKRIIEKIRGKIEKGEYRIIIGDDASGRIPALILSGFIKKITKIKKLHSPEMIFIPGGLSQTANLNEKLKNHLAQHGFTGEGKILVVTEAIRTGSKLRVLTKMLKELGFEFDIATAGIEMSRDLGYLKTRQGNLNGGTVISGEYSRRSDIVSNPTPLTYSRKFATGVYKRPGDLQSRTTRSGDLLGTTSPQEKEMIQNKIKQSREEVGMMVDRLVDWYLSSER